MAELLNEMGVGDDQAADVRARCSVTQPMSKADLEDSAGPVPRMTMSIFYRNLD